MTANGPRVQRRKFNDGEAVTTAYLNDLATEGQVTALDGALSLLFALSGASVMTLSGGFLGRGFRPHNSGGSRTIYFDAGAAIYSREADGGLDPTDPAYANLPMLLPLYNLVGTTSVTLDAHDATNPRWDLLSLAPVETLEDAANVRVRVSVPGTQAVQSLNRRARWYPQITVTKGTPAGSPTVPSLPAGHLRLGVAYVPAVSGDVLVYDRRTLTNVANAAAPSPTSRFGNKCVVSGLVTSLTSGLGVQVSAGSASDGSGNVRYFDAVTATLTADPSNPVIYAVEASHADGYVKLTRGTPAATPTEPTITGVPLAFVTVPAAATTLTSTNVELLSTRGPYTGSMAEIPTAHLDVQLGAISSNHRDLTVQAVDWSGANIAAPVAFEVKYGTSSPESVDAVAGVLTDTVTTGNHILHFGATRAAVFKTDATGLAVVRLTVGSAWTGWITVTPIAYLDANTAASAAAMGRQRYRPGGPVLLEVDFS